MAYKFYRVESFKIVAPYCLEVSFDDLTAQKIDFRPVLFGTMYSPLRDLEMFEQVRLDPEVHTLVWPNGADFNPSMLHDWNSNSEEIGRSAAKLDAVSV